MEISPHSIDGNFESAEEGVLRSFKKLILKNNEKNKVLLFRKYSFRKYSFRKYSGPMKQRWQSASMSLRANESVGIQGRTILVPS